MPMHKGLRYSEMLRVRLTKQQKKFLERKAQEQTKMLKREVSTAMVLRALIQRQIDIDSEEEKIWDD